jgi:quercetin dioxygenase-like cupin family protein
MNVSRRDLGVLLPVLAAAAARRPAHAQTTPAAAPTPARTTLGTRNYHHSQIAYNGNDTKKGRRFFMGETHGGFNLEAHETVLGPGVQTHAPHRHVHEEIIIVVEGTVETFVEGKTDTVEAGSVIFYGTNQLHNARNVGKVPARYYVIELRGDD